MIARYSMDSKFHMTARGLHSAEGMSGPIPESLIAQIAKTHLAGCVAIHAVDVLGPSAWSNPTAYTYLAEQARAYLKATLVDEQVCVLVSEKLGAALSRAQERAKQELFRDKPVLSESMSVLANPAECQWGLGPAKLQMSRILVWTEEELADPLAQTLIDFHETFYIPLFYKRVTRRDPLRALDFIAFERSNGGCEGFLNRRVGRGFELDVIQRNQIPGRGPVAEAYAQLLDSPDLMLAKDARYLLMHRRTAPRERKAPKTSIKPMRAKPAPLDITLELIRGDSPDESFALFGAGQAYLRRLEGGTFQSATFPWSDALRENLAQMAKPLPDRRGAQRVGNTLRSFLLELGWAQDEQRIEKALRQGRSVRIVIRSKAAELFSLPWELVTLKTSGEHLSERDECLLRYEWSDRAVGAPAKPRLEGRILFAWSASAGSVPASEQCRRIQEACARAGVPFDERRDVVANASVAELARVLASSTEPIAVLHILCHGGRIREQGDGLFMNGTHPGEEDGFVNAAVLRKLLGRHARRIGMVVLSACRSGDTNDTGNPLGSAAQALHRVGIPAVVASRFPLSIEGSVKLTEALYSELLAEGGSLESAMRAARHRLGEAPQLFDWASLQLYARAEALALRYESGPTRLAAMS